jgi:putative ABC transport system permease protein
MMPVSLHLAIRQWLARPLRPMLCSLAIAAAVALVVCVGAGFDSIRATLKTTVTRMLGTADIHVRSKARPPANHVSTEVLDNLRKRPEVALASGRLQAQLAIAVRPPPGEAAPNGAPNVRWFAAIGIDPANDDRLRPKHYVTGGPLTGPADQIVIDEAVAREIGARVGDKLSVGNGLEMHPATVVGIIAGPTIELVQQPMTLVTAPVLARAMGLPLEYSVIDLELQPDVSSTDYAEKLQKELGPTLAVASAAEGPSKMERETAPMDWGLWILSIISAICAALIIGTTLSVGVQERIRLFGQLRCIGASRWQLVQALLADALLLMAMGTAMGITAGLGLSHVLVWKFPQLFVVYSLTAKSILVAIFVGLLATFVGSLIPAWQVWRISPMQAVQTAGRPVPVWHIVVMGFVGIMAIGLQITLWQIPQREVRFFCYLAAGIPLIFIGYALTGPLLLLIFERIGYKAIGSLLNLRAPLLRHAWSRTPWRSGGMIAALMIGITLFTGVRERGHGIMASWAFPQQFPDVILYRIFGTPPTALTRLAADLPDIQTISSVNAFPIRLKKGMFRIGPVLPDEQTLFVAGDPNTFGQLMKMDFLQGKENEAFEKLKRGRAVFVSREYQEARGIGLGDTITFVGSDGKDIDFTIAAVVASPGMDIAKNYFDMGSAYRDKAVSSVLGTSADAKKYFGQDRVNLALANVKPGTDVRLLRNKIEDLGWQTASSVEMKEKLTTIIGRFVDAMSLLALAGMCVASLGVTNMVIASVHARRFEFGILRAVGAGRGQLVRLVLAETSLVAFTAGLLGAIAGLHYCFMGTRVDRLLFGYQTSFLPLRWIWLPILIGVAITLPLGWLASIFPAWRGASTAQQVLLASGRG